MNEGRPGGRSQALRLDLRQSGDAAGAEAPDDPVAAQGFRLYEDVGERLGAGWFPYPLGGPGI